MDAAANEAPRALNSANLRRYTELQCPKARRRRLSAVQGLVRVLLGDPNIVWRTNTKGQVCLTGGSCTGLSAPLGGHLAFTAQEHEALSMLRNACSMHVSQRALLQMPRGCTQRDLRTVRQRIMPYFPQATIIRSTTGRNRVAAHVPLQSIVQNAICMARVIGKPRPSGIAHCYHFSGCDFLVKGILYPCGCMRQCMVGAKVCFEGEAMGAMVLHGWGGGTGIFKKP